MKINKLQLGLIFLMAILLTYSVEATNSFQSTQSKVFRFHILANSDEYYDQELKMIVKNEVFLYITDLTKDLQSNLEAMEIISENIDSINNLAQKIVIENGFNYTVTSKICNEYYTTRVYEDFSLPAGYYDGLQINIGNSEGENWWCVLFPPLCSSVATKNLTTDDIDYITNKNFEYRFKFIDTISEIKEFLN